MGILTVLKSLKKTGQIFFFLRGVPFLRRSKKLDLRMKLCCVPPPPPLPSLAWVKGKLLPYVSVVIVYAAESAVE